MHQGIQTVDELNAFYAGYADEAGIYADKFQALEDRLDEIQEGIDEAEYIAYKSSLSTMVDAIEDMQAQMEAAIVAE